VDGRDEKVQWICMVKTCIVSSRHRQNNESSRLVGHSCTVRKDDRRNSWCRANCQHLWAQQGIAKGNEVLRQEIAAFLDERQRDNKSLSLSLEGLSSMNRNHFTKDDFIRGQVGFYTILLFKGMSAQA